MDRLPEYPILLERNWFSQSTSLILSLPFLKNLHNCPIIYKIHPKLFRKGLQNLVTITFLELFLVSFFPLLYSFGLSNKFFSTIPSLGTKFFSLSTAALVALFTFLFFFFLHLSFPTTTLPNASTLEAMALKLTLQIIPLCTHTGLKHFVLWTQGTTVPRAKAIKNILKASSLHRTFYSYLTYEFWIKTNPIRD